MKVTVFKNIYDTTEPLHVDILSIIMRIRNGSSKELIEQIRSDDDKEKQAELKRRLPSICFSGEFSKREAKSLMTHSGLICLDVDDVNSKNMSRIFKLIQDDSYTYSVFVSPRGAGFKILVKITPEIANHKGHFLALENHFNEVLNDFTSTKKNEEEKDGKTVKIDSDQGDYLKVHIDKSGKDVSRVCYESYDPHIYYNQESDICDNIEEEIHESKPEADQNKIIERLQVWIDNQESYYKGNRNKYIYKFSSALSRYGVDKFTALAYLSNKCDDYPPNELKQTVDGAYKAPGNEFGSKEFTESDYTSKTIKIDIEENKAVTAFWTINDKGKVKIDTKQFLKFVEAMGYRIYRQKDSIKSWDFVKVVNMVVSIVEVMDIKKDVLDYVDINAPEPVFDELQMRNRYFEATFLNALQIIDFQQIKDTATSSYIFYNDFYYEVTAKEKIKKDYIDLDGVHIWEKQICEHPITDVVDWSKHDFAVFLYNALGKSKEKFQSACAALGYGIHTFKKQRLAKLIYTCEQSLAELDGLADGGSGKNLYQKSLHLVRSVVDIDGKEFQRQDKFKFQTVKDDTQIICIDDYEGGVRELFTKVTGHFEVERKNKDKSIIPFEDSPKIFTSSNEAPTGFSGSFARRLNIIEFTDYYNAKHRPEHEFGDKDFFSDDWDQGDYNAVYSFLFDCVQTYLKTGLSESYHEDLKYKQLIKNTGRNFAEYFTRENMKDMSTWHEGRELFDFFKSATSEDMNIQKFYSCCRIICEIYGWKYIYKGKGTDREISFKGFDFNDIKEAKFL